MRRCTMTWWVGRGPGLATLLVALLMVVLAARGEEPRGTDVHGLMRAKLGNAQQTLEGLTLGNFEQIVKNAEQLRMLSQDAAWVVLQTREYREYSEQFRRDTQRMASAARRQNLDAAGLAYVQMTLTCIHCHEHVRETRQK